MTKYFFEQFHRRRPQDFYGMHVRKDNMYFTNGFWRENCKSLNKVILQIEQNKRAFKLQISPQGYDVRTMGVSGGLHIRNRDTGLFYGKYECTKEDNGEFLFELKQ